MSKNSPFSKLRRVQFQLHKYAEGRAFFEFQSFYLTRSLLKRLPKGDGHPVIVFPGFVGSDISTIPMRKLLDDLGYSTYGWGLGRNLLYNQKRENQMRRLVRNIAKNEGRKVSLVGWSLGGIFARETAKLEPDSVRSVISMGSPVSGATDLTNVGDLFSSLNGTPSDRNSDRFERLGDAPPVPTTSIYSKSDGIVAWEASVQAEGESTQVENIVAPASHLGMGFNPLVMYLLADRLSQCEGQWEPFDNQGIKGLLFDSPNRSCIDRVKSVMNISMASAS